MKTLQEQQLSTSLGQISVWTREVAGSLPLVFLHGVYYDHHLWEEVIDRIEGHTIIALDMPLHGNSKAISKANWTLNDCAQMLIEVLDQLQIPKAISVGHSWGSMTTLRAAAKAPERFQAIGLCNLPFEATPKAVQRRFQLQHLMLRFRGFYAKQVSKAMYGKAILQAQPDLQDQLKRSMDKLSHRDIRQTDRAVILNADPAESLIQNLQMPALGLKGEEDYVPVSPHLKTRIVEGGHVSPLEMPEEVVGLVQDLILQTASAHLETQAPQ